jgi:streptogramin lyase
MRTVSLSVAMVTIICSSTSPAGEAALLRGPRGLALDAAGNLLVSCREGNSVVVMSRSGQKLRELGAGRLDKPGGLCVTPQGRVVVANTGKNELAAFDASGGFAAAVGGLAAPEDVAAGADGRLYVADTGNSRVAVLDPELKGILFSIEQVGEPPSKLKNPAGVAVARGRLVVADTGNKRLVAMAIPRRADDTAKATIIPQEDAPPRSVAVGRDGSIYAADGSQVRGFTRRGEAFGSFGAKAIRVTISYLFQPGGLAIDGAGNVLAVDKYTGRVFVTSAQLLDPLPSVVLSEKDPTTAAIEWETPSPQPTIVDYGKSDDYGLQFKSAEPTRKHRAVLKGLSPSTCYYCRIHKPFEMIPEKSEPRPGFSLRHQKKYHERLFEANVSGNNTFASLPEAGKTDWASMPVIVLVYRNVKFPAGKDGKQPPNRVLDDDDIAMLKSEMETYRTWAWRHTSCKLNLDFTYLFVKDERDHGVLGDRSRPLFEDIQKGLTEQGKDPHAFWDVNVVATQGWYAHYLDGPVAGSDCEMGACFTGFGHGQKPGWWWFPVHEHGHLVHSMMMNSEIESFAFPDAPWTMPGQFGEDFSFMAANYRRQPVRSWLTVRTTTVQVSADANGNGVPDDDPRVPLDEKRFGWSGADCLKRLMAGVRSPGYKGDSDADFEGKVHKLNEGELYWLDRKVPKGKIALDGRLAPGEWEESYSIPNITTPKAQRDLKAKLYLAWDDGHYYFAVKSNEQVIAGFDLDGANDGWFHGRDNLRFSIRPPMAGRPMEASGAIWDFLNNQINLHNGQHWYREAYKPGDIRAAIGQQDGWHVIECAVPARPDVRIAPGKSAKFALRAYLWWDVPDAQIPQTNFFDGEDFIYDLQCVK